MDHLDSAEEKKAESKSAKRKERKVKREFRKTSGNSKEGYHTTLKEPDVKWLTMTEREKRKHQRVERGSKSIERLKLKGWKEQSDR